MNPVTLADIQHAAELLKGIAHVTPVLTSRQLNEASGATAYLKCENFQRVGAFKFRGAYHAVATLPPDQRGRPVATISSGNHAQGLALACRIQGLRALVVMPEPINPLKKQAVLSYGATIHQAANRQDAEDILDDLIERHHAVHVHPFNDPHVIAGQGTAMLEFLSSVPDLEVVLAPVGGGGLLSGTCVAAHGLSPSIALHACEPAGALDAMHSVRENRIVPMANPQTIAEGLRTSLGDLTLEVLRAHLAGFFPVEEEEIVQAMRFAFERLKIVIEPSSAVALAPLLRGERALVGKRVGVILTGGNVNLSEFFAGLESKSRRSVLSPGNRPETGE